MDTTKETTARNNGLTTLGIIKGTLLTDKQQRHAARRLEGKSVLEWVVRQMTDTELLDNVAVVADAGPRGDIIRTLMPGGVPILSTNATDTATVIQEIMANFSADSCILIGSDWPFLDSELIERLIRSARRTDNCDYAAYQSMNEIFSADRPYGLFPEWYRKTSIERLLSQSDDPIYRQMPGTYFLDNKNTCNVALLQIPPGLDKIEDMQFSFDDEDDWDNILDLHHALDLEGLNCRHTGNIIATGS